MSMDSMWILCGFLGFHVSKYMIYVVKHIPCGFHVDSLDSTWNKSVPHGFHVECGGMVKYCMKGSQYGYSTHNLWPYAVGYSDSVQP